MALAALALIAGGTLYWLHARQYESTDDAFIDADVVRLAPRVAGQVLQVPVQDNEEVHAGQLVVEIDPARFQVQLDQAEAAEAQAKGRLAEAQSQLAVARANADQAAAEVGVAQAEAHNAADNFDRLQHLSGLTSSRNLAVSEREVEDARAQARSSDARLAAAQKQKAAADAQVDAAAKQIDTAGAVVSSAAAQVEQAKLELSYTRVTAPRPGRVTVSVRSRAPVPNGSLG